MPNKNESSENNLFDSSKNIFDSELKLKNVISAQCGYKEYDFEPDGSSVRQHEIEIKIQNLWRAIEMSGIEPYRPKRNESKPKAEASPSETRRHSPDCKPRTWTEALKELTQRGMDKEAESAKANTCKLCEHADLGQIFADEAYEDRYIKPTKPNQCN